MTKSLAFLTLELPAAPNNTDPDMYIKRYAWERDFVELPSDRSGEAVFSAVGAAVDRPVTVRIAKRDVKNVYAGTSIDPSYQAPARAGIDLVAEYKEVATVSDSEDPTFREDLPMRCCITINLPKHETISAATVETLVARAVGAFMKEVDSEVNGTGAAALLHGSVTKW